MEIRPKFEMNTIKMNITPLKVEKLETKSVADPSGSIPNGIYKVIRWETFRQNVTLILSSLLSLAMTILILVRALWVPMAWIGYVIPIAVFLLSFWKMSVTLIEKSSLKKQVNRYKEDLKIGLSSQPPFIIKMYRNLHIKQIKHNWLTFAFLFYVGIFTLLLWWLKDVHWWIFDFQKWISQMFHNPKLMAIIFTFSLLFVAVLHVALAIQRKRRVMEIDAYFGQNIIPASEIDTLKTERNKAFRRLFVISLMIVIVIPIIVRLVLRVLRRK